MNIQQHAQQDPDSFYTKRWADGYMVYHGRSYCFSYSITRAKDKLTQLRELTKNFILVEFQSDISRDGSELVSRVETYERIQEQLYNLGFIDLRGKGGEIQFTTMYPAQNDPKLFALRKRRLVLSPEHRLAYEALFDFEIYVSGDK